MLRATPNAVKKRPPSSGDSTLPCDDSPCIPTGIRPSPFLDPVQREVERTVFDGERVVGRLLDPARDTVAVPRAPGQGPEDDAVERALERRNVVAH